MEWIRSLPSVASGRGPCEAAHTATGGTSRKAGWETIVPLTMVEHMCERIAVMKEGRIVELGTREQVIGSPSHPYTRQLLSAVPADLPVLGERGTRQREQRPRRERPYIG